jgi:hypothetical protein
MERPSGTAAHEGEPLPSLEKSFLTPQILIYPPSAAASVPAAAKVIQGLIIFATLLGALFLWEVYPLLPPAGFDFVAIGWVLFVVDSILTFVRPKPSFYLGFVLALVALIASVGEPEHYQILQSGDPLHVSTLLLGDAIEVLLLVLIPYFFLRARRDKEWAWPGAKGEA